MKSIPYIILLVSTTLFCQEKITATLISEIPIQVEHITAIDNFETLFYTNGNTFYKKSPQQSFTYSNVQLGIITWADAFSPLKIKLFYKNFNTV